MNYNGINLIRQRYVLPAQRKEKRKQFLFLGAAFLLILLVSCITIGGIYSINQAIAHSYTRRIEKQALSRFAAFLPTDEEKSRMEELKKFVAFQEQYLFLAPKLVALSDAMPNSFYLTKINFSTNSISIQGRCLPGKQIDASLRLFLKRLNGDKNFIRGLAELELEEAGDEKDFLNFRIAGRKK